MNPSRTAWRSTPYGTSYSHRRHTKQSPVKEPFSPLPNQQFKFFFWLLFLRIFLVFFGLNNYSNIWIQIFEVFWMNESSFGLEASINVSCYSIWDEIICTAEFETVRRPEAEFERVAFLSPYPVCLDLHNSNSRILMKNVPKTNFKRENF